MSIYPQTVLNSNIIVIDQGSDYSETLTIVDDETGEAIPNLSSATIISKLRNLNGELAAEFTCTVTGPTTAKRDLNETQTAALVAATSVNHIHGLKITLADGTDYPEAQGGCMVKVKVC